MENGIFQPENLVNLLKAHWTEFIDHIRLLKQTIEYVNNTHSFVSVHDCPQVYSMQNKLSITSFEIVDNNTLSFTAEFSVVKDKGIVIGSHVYHLKLDGQLILIQSYGTHFLNTR